MHCKPINKCDLKTTERKTISERGKKISTEFVILYLIRLKFEWMGY